jgi:uncharacterized protein
MPLLQMSTLHDAALVGDAAVIANLASEGVAVNEVRDTTFASSCSTALHVAAENGHLECVKQLLALGAEAAMPNLWGHTAAHLAAACGHASVVRVR